MSSSGLCIGAVPETCPSITLPIAVGAKHPRMPTEIGLMT
eukprot:CAMPEP_0206060850 /NCGR_PEP_ID=MMETSP1466-20131121/52478_1 /ASSEMBLY_ACC=CAM_ASM_001126 /TAXON_ID=44452 /ORGANISM="Pavlova gyrans, Strain CCMP608" /LENGTH=39 /DNA_ID= /DNA_START= /DNA_END= /DNA_ORIENTATION=